MKRLHDDMIVDQPDPKRIQFRTLLKLDGETVSEGRVCSVDNHLEWDKTHEISRDRQKQVDVQKKHEYTGSLEVVPVHLRDSVKIVIESLLKCFPAEAMPVYRSHTVYHRTRRVYGYEMQLFLKLTNMKVQLIPRENEVSIRVTIPPPTPPQ